MPRNSFPLPEVPAAKSVYEVNTENAQQIMSMVISKALEDMIRLRYAGKVVDSKMACAFLDITPKTLYKYIDMKILTPIENDNRNIEFDLGDLILFDIKSVKGKHLIPSL